MKVISGKFKGKVLEGYNIKGTRPTMDRVKESLFASINPYIKDKVFLDLFAGSGSLGIEAISNGCSFCYFNDINRDIFVILKNNIQKLGINNCKLFNKDYKDVILSLKNNDIKIDVILLDPPYCMNILNSLVLDIINKDILNDDGLIVIEHQDNFTLCDYEGYILFKNKKYGNKFITILKKCIDN